MNYTGIGVSPGVVTGPIRRVIAQKVTGPVPADIDQVLKALDAVAADLEQSAETIELEVAKEVLGAQAMMARDPSVIEVLEAAISEGVAFDVRPIIEEAFGGFKEQLLALVGYFFFIIRFLFQTNNHPHFPSTPRGGVLFLFFMVFFAVLLLFGSFSVLKYINAVCLRSVITNIIFIVFKTFCFGIIISNIKTDPIHEEFQFSSKFY